MAAFDMLRMDPDLHFGFALTPIQAFAWLTTAGLLGVLLSVPMRQHFVVEERLTFADGIAAGETLIVLDSRGTGARDAARAMGIGTGLSALIMTLREDTRLIAEAWYRIPEMLRLGPTGASMGVGVSWSLLSLGAGMLVGLRVNLSMVIGAILAWVIAPPLLLQNHVVDELVRRKVLLWVMWPATGILIAGGLTALVLRWRLLVKTFRNLSGAEIRGEDFPIRWVIVGSVVCGIALVVVQHGALGMSVWMTIVAMLLSVPLMLVGIRVLGETNWGPIRALSNMRQAIFGAIAPGQIMPNMVSSGVTGSIASESEGLIQSYKTAHDRQHAALPHVRSATGGADRRGGGGVRLPAASRHLRNRRGQRAAVADLAEVGRLRAAAVGRAECSTPRGDPSPRDRRGARDRVHGPRGNAFQEMDAVAHRDRYRYAGAGQRGHHHVPRRRARRGLEQGVETGRRARSASARLGLHRRRGDRRPVSRCPATVAPFDHAPARSGGTPTLPQDLDRVTNAPQKPPTPFSGPGSVPPCRGCSIRLHRRAFHSHAHRRAAVGLQRFSATPHHAVATSE
jgi:hypothetical protein